MSRRPPWLAVLVWVVCAFVMGSDLEYVWLKAAEPRPAASIYPLELRRSQDGFVEPVPPISILLRVVTREEFRRLSPSGNTVAFTYPYRRPCEIVVPEGWSIQAQASNPTSGSFVTADAPDALAHEILHCIVGGWHAEEPHE